MPLFDPERDATLLDDPIRQFEPGVTYDAPPTTDTFDPLSPNGPTEFTKGVVRGISGAKQGTYDFLRIGTDALGFDAASEQLDKRAVESIRQGQLAPPRIGSLAEAETPEDYLDFLVGGTAESLPFLATTLASGGTAGITAKVLGYGAKAISGARAGGAFASIAAPESGASFREIETATGEKHPGLALGAGAIIGALDTYSLGKGLQTFLPKGLKGKAASLFYDVSTTAAREGVTEAVQELVNLGAVRTAEDKELLGKLSPEELQRVLDVAALGTAGGTVFGAVGGGAARTVDLLESKIDPHKTKSNKKPSERLDELFGKFSPEQKDTLARSFNFDGFDELKAHIEENEALHTATAESFAEYGALSDIEQAGVDNIFYEGGVPWPSVELWAEAGTKDPVDGLTQKLEELYEQDPKSVAALKAALKAGASEEEAFRIMEQMSPFERRTALDLAKKNAEENNSTVEVEAAILAERIFAKWPKFKDIARQEGVGLSGLLSQMHYVEKRETSDVVPEDLVTLSTTELTGRGNQSILRPAGKFNKVAKGQIPVRTTVNGKEKTYGLDSFKLINAMLRKTQASDRTPTTAERFAQAFYDGITAIAAHENIDVSEIFDAIKNMPEDQKKEFIVYRLRKTKDSKGRAVPGKAFSLYDMEQAHNSSAKTKLSRAQVKLKKLQKLQEKLATIATEAVETEGIDDARYNALHAEYKEILKKHPLLEIDISLLLQDIVALELERQISDEANVGFEIDGEIAFGESVDIQTRPKAPIHRGYSTTDNPTSEAFFNFQIRDELYEDLKDSTDPNKAEEKARIAADLYNSLLSLREAAASLEDTNAQDAAWMMNLNYKLTVPWWTQPKPKKKLVTKEQLLAEIDRHIVKAEANLRVVFEGAALDSFSKELIHRSASMFPDTTYTAMTRDEIETTDWSAHEGFNYVIEQVERMASALGLKGVKVLTPGAALRIMEFGSDGLDLLSGTTSGFVIESDTLIHHLSKKYPAATKEELAEIIKDATGIDVATQAYGLYVNPKHDKQRTLAIAAHEAGHIVLYEALKNGTLTAEILKEYSDWVEHLEKDGPLTREVMKDKYVEGAGVFIETLLGTTIGGKGAQKPVGESFIKYQIAFEEWFADRVRNRMLDPSPPKTLLDRLIEKLVKKLRIIFGLKVTVEDTVEDFTDALLKRSQSRAWNSPQEPHEVLKTWESTIKFARNANMSASERDKFDGTVYSIISEFFKRTLGLKVSQFDAEFYQELAAMQRDDAMGAAFNKAIRQGFLTLMSAKERQLLLRATSSPYVKRQLANLLRFHPEAWAEVVASPNARMSYAYQFWITGQLELSKRSGGVFRKIYEALRDLFGIVRDSENAEMLFNEFTTGGAYLRAQGHNGSSFYIKEASKDTVIQKAFHNVLAPAWENVASSRFGHALFSTASARMVQTENEWLIQLNNEVNAPVGTQFVQEDMLTQRTQMVGRFTNEAYAIFEDKDKQFGLDVLAILNKGRAFTKNQKKVNDPSFKALSEVEQAAVKTQLLMAEMHRYMVEAGLNVGHIENYFPWVFDEEYTRDNANELVALLSDPKFAKAIKELGTTPEDLVRSIITSGGYADIDVEIDDIGHVPGLSAMNKRSLIFVEELGTPAQREQLAAFFDTNIGHTLNKYIEQAVKRSEYHRRFGQGKIQTLLKQAKRTGATAADLELAETYMSAIMGTHGYETNRKLAELLGMDPPEQGEVINPKLQRAMGIAMVYQNVRVLALATLTSLVDPLGIAVRTGEVGISYMAFREGVRASFSHARGNKEIIIDMAEMLGIIDRHMTVEALNWEYGGIYIQGTERHINEQFFRYTGLQAWTRATRVMALEGGLRFIARHVNNPNQHSERYLAELNLRPEDVIVDEKGKTKILTAAERRAANAEEIARDDRVRAALHRFVDGSILRPNATVRPIWASDPHYMLLFHLKAFMYSFHERILKRVALEAEHANLAPLVMLGMFIPFMLASDMLRDLIQHGVGGNPQKEQWGFMEYISSAAERSGLYGLQQIQLDALKDIKYGGLGYESFMGPTWGQMEDILLKENYDILDAVPTQNVWKYWMEQ